VQTVCVYQPQTAVITKVGAFRQINPAARADRHQHGATVFTKVCLPPVDRLALRAGSELPGIQSFLFFLILYWKSETGFNPNQLYLISGEFRHQNQ
jgi:hypothetical protein